MTSAKNKFPLKVCQQVGESLIEMLSPCVERIVIAGSVRRKRPFCSDVELLFIPRLTKVKTGLFGEDFTSVDEADFKLQALLTAGILALRLSKTGVAAWGPKNKLAVHVPSGIPVDFFSTTADKWWNALVCRTGGKENNLLITTTANRKGWTFEAYGMGFHRINNPGQRHNTTSERDVYEFLNLNFLEPEQRK